MHMRRNALAATAGVLIVVPFVVAAWTGPTQSPPGGNVAAPINVGMTDQVKNGGLGVNALTVFGNSLLGGSTGSNAYLNFGATAGANGYGIRDNAGLLEFKNSGGTWKSLQATVFDLVGGAASWTVSGNDIYNNNTGNVGIGTTVPSHKMSVSGGPAWTSVGWHGSLALANVGAIGWQPNASGHSFGIGQSNGGLYFFRTNSAPGTVGSPPTYNMIIADSGYVGINTTNPRTALDVRGGGIAITNGPPSTLSGYMIAGPSDEVADYDEEFIITTDDPSTDTHGDSRSSIYIGPSHLGPAGRVQINASKVVFPGGNVGIGTQSPGYKLEVAGTAKITGDTYLSGIAASSVGYYACIDSSTGRVTRGSSCSLSDIRLKRNIITIASALENPSKITGVYFNWKDEARDRADGRQVGLIAQDVEKVYPEAVINNPDGTKAVNYDALMGPMVEAIKQLKAQNDALHTKLLLWKRE